jgi:conjugal transfer pilus assembly protein TraB
MLKKLLNAQDGNIRRHQRILSTAAVGITGAIGLISILYFFGRQEQNQQHEKVEKVEKKQLTTPMDVIDEKDVWASRVEKRAETAEKQVQKLEAENQMIYKRIDILEEVLRGARALSQEPSRKEIDPSSDQRMEGPPYESSTASDSIQQNLNGQTFPRNPNPEIDREPTLEQIDNVSARGNTNTNPKILHLSLPGASQDPLHTAENYIPSGTYAKAVLTSGVVASTSTQAQGNPQPIMLRLADEGNLPRGWKSTVKDAVLIGACYGDLSSERVLCRLESMSWVEANGETVERKVEGWIIGEDGRPGLRGLVVDRAGDVARESFIAGILSGLSTFLQFESTRGVYPMTPFGQTNALSTPDALVGGLGKGATNALDKLADFSIKRAESMSPVLVVNSGRVVDVVFRKGVDLFGAQSDYKVIGSEQVPTPHQTMPKD